jgi:cation diffusion facilitator family transporter
MAKILKRAAGLSLLVNCFLFLIKAAAGFASNSIAIISDAINSLTDIVSSIAILYSIKVSLKKPDDEHQFGHHAAQPIAVFVIALFSGVVGIEVIKESISRISTPGEISITLPVYIIIISTIFIKFFLTRFQSKIGKDFKSPGLKASAVDSLNDVLASSLSLIGVVGVQLGFPYVDGAAGILIAFFIFKSGYEIAKENIDYLMGKSAGDDLLLEIANTALKINGVKGINELRSHHVGNKFHVEIHIDVDKKVSTEASHDIAVKVQRAVLNLPDINKVFVHIDPI